MAAKFEKSMLETFRRDIVNWVKVCSKYWEAKGSHWWKPSCSLCT